MADQFIGEIRIVGFNFPPTGWAFCNGQPMPISQNTALFSLLGTFYGGDGRSTFALPDMQGNAPIAQGQGPGLTQRFIGETSGSSSVTLLQQQIPSHTHNLQAYARPATSADPTNNSISRSANTAAYVDDVIASRVQLAANSGSIVGSSLPHNNMQPYLVLNFVIALQGIFPPRA